MTRSFHNQEKLIGNLLVVIPIEVDSGFQGLQNQYENTPIPHVASNDDFYQYI